MFEKDVLYDEERRKELYKCLIEIRNLSRSDNLAQTETHRFLQALKRSGKLRRCYTQNFDGLEARAGLNADMESEDCEVVQLHGNLDTLRCSSCGHSEAWDDVDEAALSSGKIVHCPKCTSRVEERRQQKRRTNIHVGHLRPNIVLFNDLDPLDELKASIIDDDTASRPDLLLIMGTSLAVYGPRRELKDRLIPATRRNGGRVIYVNSQPPPTAFRKPVVDHSFVMDCDTWVRELATRKTSLSGEEDGQIHRSPPPGFKFQPKAKTVEEVLKEADSSLISIGDYSGFPFRCRNKKDMREDLGTFLPRRWLGTSALMCVLSLFEWGESTLVMHSKFMAFDVHDVREIRKKLEGMFWPVGRQHTRIIVPYNPGDHWILIEVDIPDRVVRYYNSLPGYEVNAACKYVETQVMRAGTRLGRYQPDWGLPVDGVRALLPL